MLYWTGNRNDSQSSERMKYEFVAHMHIYYSVIRQVDNRPTQECATEFDEPCNCRDVCAFLLYLCDGNVTDELILYRKVIQQSR